MNNAALLLIFLRSDCGKTKAEVETADVGVDRTGDSPRASGRKGEDDRACVHQGGGTAE